MRTLRRHTHIDELELPGNAWLCTFNDMMTLLLVFFVLLFSMGTIDGPLLKNMQQSLQNGLGVLANGKPAADRDDQELTPTAPATRFSKTGKATIPDDSTVREMTVRIAERINRLEGTQRIKIGAKGQLIMDNSLLFSFGKAELNPEGLAILRRLAQELQAIPNRIRIEGHSDNIPIRTEQYPSNWELSTARAVNVVKYMAGPGRIAPERLAAAGYADVKPLQPNSSPSNRALNRRVEIVLLKGKGQ